MSTSTENFVKSDEFKMAGNVAMGRIFFEMAIDERMGTREIAPKSSEIHVDVVMDGEMIDDYEFTMCQMAEEFAFA